MARYFPLSLLTFQSFVLFKRDVTTECKLLNRTDAIKDAYFRPNTHKAEYKLTFRTLLIKKVCNLSDHFCSPLFNMRAIFQQSGKTPVAKERLKMSQRDSASIGSPTFKKN